MRSVWVLVLACLLLDATPACCAPTVQRTGPIGAQGLRRAAGSAIPPQVAQVLTRPVSRSQAIGAMMASDVLFAAAGAALPPETKMETLPMTAVSGRPMPIDPLPRAGDTPVAAGNRGTSAGAEGPARSINDLNWERGVFLQPLQAPPAYSTPRQDYWCADMLLYGVTIHTGLFIASDYLTYHLRGDSRVQIDLNLPDGPGTYLLSFNLWYLTAGVFDAARIHITATSSRGTEALPFSLAPETEEYRMCRPLVALLEIERGQAPLSSTALWPLERKMVQVVCDWPGAGAGSVFGGVTVTRL